MPAVDDAISERALFVATTVPELLGRCLHPTDYETWCGPHDSLWMPNEPRCRKVGDMTAFAAQVVEQWDRRPGARAATNFLKGTIDDLAAQVRVLEEGSDGR